MSLSRSTRLGSYEIVDLLGQGGMGEVYRARDTKLNRDVAVKVLPASFAADPDRLARFQREAQTLASLNHPNIAQIFGIVDGPAALVMEFVDGEDLSKRIARGPVPLDEALPIARQIAAALEAAHERGIVHRDLKPANIKVRSDGTVKVLDFGLAIDTGRSVDSVPLADSPTFTSPAMLTRAGVILGTAAYMAPEQARGKAVDQRADIWAFGCVLFEMLTGRHAFDADSTADLFHAILGRDPDWARLPGATPSRVRDVLGWCLRRDPEERLRDAGDVRLLLTSAESTAAQPIAAPPPRRSILRSALPWTAALLALVALAWTRVHAPQSSTPRTLHLELPLSPPDDAVQQQFGSSFALSPDGARVVYVARAGSSTALFMHDLETGASRQIPDSADAYAPFFSPSGSAVGFTAGDRLRTIGLTAPLARDVIQVPLNGHVRVTGAWTENGILFFDGRGVSRVPANGGSAALLVATTGDEAGFATPRGVPGDRVLVARRRAPANKTDDPSEIALIDPSTGERRVLIDRGASPALLQDPAGGGGFLIYARDGRIWAAKIDMTRWSVVGSPQPVVDNVEMRPNGEGAQFAVSASGTLAYLEGSRSELVWVDESGRATPASSLMRRFAMPRISPDGRSVAVEVQDVPHQIWRLDLNSDTLTPLTRWKNGSHDFAWSPDGGSIIFTGSTPTGAALMWTPVDGSREPVQVDAAPTGGLWAEDWSRDGTRLAVIHRTRAETELQIVPLTSETPPTVKGTPTVLSRGRECGISPQFSADGQWLAWCDCAGTGPLSVTITRLADGRRYQIDTGIEPKWSVSGRLLYYRKGPSMMVVDVAGGSEPVIGRPRKLFDGDFLEWGIADYDASRDNRLIMVRQAATNAGRALAVRVNWIEELKRLSF